MLKFFKFFFIFFLLLGVLYYFYSLSIQNYILRILGSDLYTPKVEIYNSTNDIEVYLDSLEIPWEVEFLPNNDLLVTLRKGDLLLYRGKELQKKYTISEVNVEGEGGLLGIAIHPQFEENNFIYLYFTTRNQDKFINKVVRYKLLNTSLEKDKEILTDIRGNVYHNAGKIAFGPDGFLYITAGDALDEPSAQDRLVLAGKILRVDSEGNIPKENPFNNQVYSYGHRNPQGLTWDSDGNLWSTEHGQSGIKSGQDELNKITIGGNYGWPIIRGSQEFQGYNSPIIQSGDRVTWAPGDAEYFAGNIFFTGLRGAGVYRYNIQQKTIVKYLDNEFGRLRAITLGPDGYFYITTSNKDGRGTPREDDDKILRINPQIFIN